MTYAWREIDPTSDVFGVTWIINAPWAHPIWHQYWIALYDLTTPHPGGAPTLYLPDATHEFIVYALDPEHPIAKDTPIHEAKCVKLKPPNYGYQFKAESNDAALARVQMIVDGIVADRLSPDTDFRSLWDKLLADCYPLVR